ncbi:MAG: energy-coupling factor ABC transporter permease [Nitrospirae bacterium]|nr:energy-coupling factor ABC transporter permease [Nitrospirota bacterium]
MYSQAFLIVSIVMLCASPAHAMHISEGILPAGWASLWSAAALPFLAWGIRKTRLAARENIELKPLLGVTAAAVFIISCMPIPVPTAGTCSHPCGTAISAILLGPAMSILTAAAALLIQAMFMAHGGLTTWGANIMSMGVAGSLAGYAVFRLLRRFGAGLGASAFAAGVLADWGTYAATAFELASSISGADPVMPLFLKIAAAFVPTQFPLGILEGFMTAGMVTMLAKRRPDMLVRFGMISPKEVSA